MIIDMTGQPYKWVEQMANAVSEEWGVEPADMIASWALDGAVENALTRGLHIQDQEARARYFEAASALQFWMFTGQERPVRGRNLDEVPF